MHFVVQASWSINTLLYNIKYLGEFTFSLMFEELTVVFRSATLLHNAQQTVTGFNLQNKGYSWKVNHERTLPLFVLLNCILLTGFKGRQIKLFNE